MKADCQTGTWPIFNSPSNFQLCGISQLNCQVYYGIIMCSLFHPVPPQAVDGAHSQGNNINSLAILSSPIMPMLVSGCKGGLLKLWNPDNCTNIGEPIIIISMSCVAIFTQSIFNMQVRSLLIKAQLIALQQMIRVYFQHQGIVLVYHVVDFVPIHLCDLYELSTCCN